MDEMFVALFTGDGEDDDDVEGPVGYGSRVRGEMNARRDGARAQEGHRGEEEEESEEGGGVDMDLGEVRPLKRSRSSIVRGGISHHGALSDSGNAARSESIPCPACPRRRAIGQDDGKEVIEILSDDEDVHHQLLSRNSSDPNRVRRGVESCSSHHLQQLGGSAAAGGSAGGSAAGSPGARSSRHGASADHRGGFKGSHGSHTSPSSSGIMSLGMGAMGGSSTHGPATRSGASPGVSAATSIVYPWNSIPAGFEERDREGKPSPAAAAVAPRAEGDGAGWLGGAAAATKIAAATIPTQSHTADSDNDDAEKDAPATTVQGQTGSTTGTSTTSGDTPISGTTPGSASSAQTTSVEFPLNLECAMCFNPLAVSALFACGHGSCWECAHEWCSRETSPTMDCPTCHVSIPRNDLRRCVVLDQVVDRAVVAAGMDDDEWRTRLERGQKLAKKAETRRRDTRDAQRAAEETIAKQAEELEKLREEAKSRGPGRRSWRLEQDLPSSMTDYGLRLMSGRRDFLDPASHRSAMEEFARFRSRRVDGAESTPSVRDTRGAGDAAAPSMVMPSTAAHGGSVRSRGPGHTSVGPGEGDPWFALRPSQPSRQPGVAMTGRVGRELLGRSSGYGRRNGAGTAAPGVGVAQSAGAVLKSAHEQARGGSDWRLAYLNAGRLSSSSSGGGGGGAGGGYARPLVTTGSQGVGGHVNVGSAAAVGGAIGSTLDLRNRGGPGAKGTATAQIAPGRLGVKRPGLTVTRAGGPPVGSLASTAASTSASTPSPSHPLVGALGTNASPSPQFDRFGGASQRDPPTRGNVGTGQLFNRSLGSGRPVSQAPMLDLEELMGQDDSVPRSEWDDVLASISVPHVGGTHQGLGRSDADASRG